MNLSFRVLFYELPKLLRVASSRQYLLHCAGISLRKRWFIFAFTMAMIFAAGYVINLPIITLLLAGVSVGGLLILMIVINSLIRHSQDVEVSEFISEKY